MIKVKKQTESIVLENKLEQKLRIYRVEGSATFCIGIEDEDHFEFEAGDAEVITKSINTVVYSNE